MALTRVVTRADFEAQLLDSVRVPPVVGLPSAEGAGRQLAKVTARPRSVQHLGAGMLSGMLHPGFASSGPAARLPARQPTKRRNSVACLEC